MSRNHASPQALKDILFSHITSGATDRVKTIVEEFEPQDLNSMRNEYGYSFISQACCLGEVETTKILLNAGADVDLVDDNGSYPLECAAWGGFAQLVQVLLDAGADPDLDLASTPQAAPLSEFVVPGHSCYESIHTARAIRKSADNRRKLMEIPTSTHILREPARVLKF